MKALSILLLFLQDVITFARVSDKTDSEARSIQSFLGSSHIKEERWDDSDYVRMFGGPVMTDGQLDCNFSGKCCYANQENLNPWILALGIPDRNKMKEHFGTRSAPTGKYLVAAWPSTAIHFASCTLSCVTKPVKVTWRFWKTRGITVKVCKRSSFMPVEEKFLFGCYAIPRSSTAGESEIYFEPGELFDVVLVAKPSSSGSGFAIVEDLRVDYSLCWQDPTPAPSTTRNTPTKPSIANQCAKVKCSFETGDACAYSLDGFEVVTGRYQNRITGISRAAEERYYLASYVSERGQKTIVETEVDLGRRNIIELSFYEATRGLKLKACCDNENRCPFKTSAKGPETDDRRWKQIQFTCPDGTRKLMFVCENTADLEGACGIDNIRLMKRNNAKQLVDACS